MPILSFKHAIRDAQELALRDKRTFIIGEGVPDPKAVFGTTAGLKEKFPDQVFDMPVSEAGLTGVCIGAAINDMRPIMVHQRMDFSLYSMDQIVNNAAKWFSMFGGHKSCPLVIRMIIGRGWGAGNQHSQNLTAMYAHVPGLKIVMPSTAYDAKGLLLSAIKDPNPVLFIEHRWLYDTTSEVPDGEYFTPIGEAKVTKVGENVTIVSSGHATKEAHKACMFLSEQGVSAELIDLRTIKPLPEETIFDSLNKTGRLLVVDDAWRTCGLGGEIIARVAERMALHTAPVRLTYPDYPSGSSPGLTKDYYVGPLEICKAVSSLLAKKLDMTAVEDYQKSRIHDVPDQNFKGPF